MPRRNTDRCSAAAVSEPADRIVTCLAGRQSVLRFGKDQPIGAYRHGLEECFPVGVAAVEGADPPACVGGYLREGDGLAFGESGP